MQGAQISEEEEPDEFQDAVSDQNRRLHRVTTATPHRVDNSGYNRRFSVRMGGHPDLVPPSLPNNAAQMVKQNSVEKKPLAVELSSPDYDAAEYMKRNLANADADSINKFTSELSKLSLQNKHEVKKAIGQSLNSVLDVSKSISQTDQMLTVLKTTVGQLNDVLVQQAEAAEVDQKATKPSAAEKRRSVMILEKKWASDLSILFKEVDGAQQFVSAAPGRHVVAESKRWGELNPLTRKPIRPAHLIVLNDRFLLATRKRVDDKKRTIATGCWPIREMTLVDELASPADKDDYTLAFKILNMTLLFQTDSQNEYNKIRSAFKKAKADDVQLSDADETRRHSIRRSLSRISSDRLSRNSLDALQDLSSQLTHRRVRSRDATERNSAEQIESIDENFTNVEIYLGHHQFAEAIGFVNRLREQIDALNANTKDDNQLRLLVQVKDLRLQELTDSIVESLNAEVSNPRSSNDHIAEEIELFGILNLSDKGRTVMLNAKTKQLDERVSNVKFEGDLRNYLLQVSIIYFNFIRQVYILYAQCFSETKDKTFIIEWANERVSDYNKIFHRQLIDYNRESAVYVSCAQMAREQSESLKKLGMNVDYLFDF